MIDAAIIVNVDVGPKSYLDSLFRCVGEERKIINLNWNTQMHVSCVSDNMSYLLVC